MKLRTSHMSDSHNETSVLTGEGDILFHSGDATREGTEEEVEKFAKFLKMKLNSFDHIVFTPGNHDFLFAENENLARSILQDKRIHVLINESVELSGFKIYGSPFSRKYKKWAFMKEGEELFKEWAKIPLDVEILLTHSPPYGILDFADFSSGNLGCQNLRYRIETDFKNLKLHQFGHIHESNGIKEIDNKVFLNAATAGAYNAIHNFTIGPYDAWNLIWENKKIINYERLGD